MAAGGEFAQQIDRAIGAHGMWKTRLKDAVTTGVSEFNVETVKVDNRCEFGRWLHQEASVQTRADPRYAQVRTLHAQFHQEAAAVLAQALAGKQTEARAALALRSPFASASARLTQAMVDWRKTGA